MKKQIKVAYFPSTATKNLVLSSNGKSLDKYCIKCETNEDLSTGNYILDATFLIEDNLQDLLQEEVILKVLMDYGSEVFRISKPTVGTRYVSIVARQITIADSLTLWLEDVRPTTMSGAVAGGYMVSNATGTKEIQVVSDIATVSTAYYMKMSLYKALHDTEQSFLNKWGGEVLRRGYVENINNHIGIDRGFAIREGKNLVGFECSSNIDNLITRAQGKGSDGIVGNYIDSPLINAYNRVYTDTIEYPDVKVKDANNTEGYDTLELAQVELDRLIALEYSQNGIDKIKAVYDVNFVQLEKTEEYKNYIVAERVYLGDTLRVYIPRLNTDIKVRAISKAYDILAQKTKEIKLSNYIENKSLTLKQITELLKTMDSTESILQQAVDNATLLIKLGLKNSYVTVRENEIVIGDTKDINTMTNVWRFNNGGLGHSSDGYYGTFDTAITMDGTIVGKFITGLIVTGEQVRAGILSSLDGSVSINLNDGKFSFGGSTGATTITDDYIEVKHENVNTVSVMDANGFKIYAQSDTLRENAIGSLVGDTSSFSTLTVNKVVAQNILTMQQENKTIYVNGTTGNDANDGSSGAPLRTIQTAIDSINNIFDHYYRTVTIYVYGNCDEDVTIENFTGVPSMVTTVWPANAGIIVLLDRLCVLTGSILINNCTIPVVIDGARGAYNDIGGALIKGTGAISNLLQALGSSNAIFSSLRIQGMGENGTVNGMFFGTSSGNVMNIDMWDLNRGLIVGFWSHIVASAMYGSRIAIGIQIDKGAIVNYPTSQTQPNATIKLVNTDGQMVYSGTVPIAYNSYSSPTSGVIPTGTQTTSSYATTSTKSWRDNWGWRSDTNDLYQGVYGSNGTHRGFMIFSSAAIRTALSGATINGCKLYLKRNSSGGVSGGVPVTLWGHIYDAAGGGSVISVNYGVIGSWAWGESKYVTIPIAVATALKSGAIHGLAIYSTGNYAIFNPSATLQVTYTK